MPVFIPVPRVARRPHPVIVARGLRGLGAVIQVLDPSVTQTITAAIVRQEGYNPSFAPNNNPGNLIYAGQAGAVPGAGGFASFATYQDGLNALSNQVQLYAGRGLTIQQMFNVYAPASTGNDPVTYAANVASALGVSPDTPLVALSGGGVPAIDPALFPSNVYTDAGLVSLDSLLSGVDPVWLGVGAGVAGLLLYAALG